MSEQTMGQRISQMRKNNNFTQEQLAEKLGVTAQSVSKWENDMTSPDISLLPQIAKIFGVTTDVLLGAVTQEEAKKLYELTNKQKKNLMLKIDIRSADGDKVKVNLPYSFIKVATETGLKIDSVNSKLNGIDFDKLMECVELGMTGKLVEIDSADGDHIDIWVE